MPDDLAEFRTLRFMESRIPVQDALETFVAAGSTPDPAIAELTARSGFSRWYPVEGGHRVLILYEGGQFDETRLQLRPGAWDHEHCTRCGATIAAGTLCWVTESGPYVLLDEPCYRLVEESRAESG